MVDIRTNLLRNRRSLSEKEYQQERSYLRYSIVGMVIVVLVVVAFAIWNFVLNIKLTKIDTSLKAANKEMQGLVQASTEQIYLKTRLSLLTGFLSSRADARTSLEKVLSTEIPGTHISKLAFEDDITLGVSYVASSSADLNKLLSYYEEDTGYFTQIVNKGVGRQEDDTYQISLLLTLPKGEK